MEKYYFVTASLPLDIQSEVEEFAQNSCNCQGIEDFSLEEAKVDEILGERSYSGGDLPVSVLTEVEGVIQSEDAPKKYYFSLKEDALKLKKLLDSNKLACTFHEEDIKDWNEEWKKGYSPILVGPELEIIPSWEKETYTSKSQKQVYIYPGFGFGTGSHETTYLCMQLMLESLDTDGNECLDFGCGSGILGIAYREFKDKSPIDLYDIDSEALENCKQNLELNSVDRDGVNLLLPKDRKVIEKKYDLVFANILQNVLLLEKDYLARSLKNNGALILSGLLKGQEDEVIEQYKSINPDLKFVKCVQKNDWVAVLMRQ